MSRRSKSYLNIQGKVMYSTKCHVRVKSTLIFGVKSRVLQHVTYEYKLR